MLCRVLSFDLTNVIFAACFTLRSHDTHIFCVFLLSGFCFWSAGRIGPLMQTFSTLFPPIFSKVPPGSE